MRTRSFSFREIVRGFSKTSFEVLLVKRLAITLQRIEAGWRTPLPPLVYCAVLQPILRRWSLKEIDHWLPNTLVKGNLVKSAPQ